MLDPRELAPEAPRLLTRAEFRKLSETDLFDEDERIELIRGVLVRVNPPLPHPSHDAAIQRLNRLFAYATVVRRTRGEKIRLVRLPDIEVAVHGVLGQ